MNRTYFLTFAIVSMLLLSCDGMDAPSTGDGPDTPPVEDVKVPVLTLDADTFYIKADGNDKSTFVVRLDGETLTEGYTISRIVGGAPEEYDSDSWSASDEGEASFVATYTLPAEDGAEPVVLETPRIVVKAVSYDVPATAYDPQPANLDFVRRILLTQFTGTECVSCPGMKKELETFMSNAENSSRSVLASVHSGVFTETDPARLDVPLHEALGANVKPALVLNFNTSASYSLPWVDGFSSNLASKFARLYNESEAKAGISVNAVRTEGVLRVKAAVKAAEASDFRIGAWILEDGIEGVQAGINDKDYYIHDNCVRAVEGEVSKGEDYSGYRLGYIEAGCRGEYVFEFDIDDSWVFDNCHLVVFITTPNSTGTKYYVNNVIDCPITGQTPFDYLEE